MAKRVPPTRFPDAVVASYYRSIDKMVQQAGEATLALFDKHLKEYIDSNRADSSSFFIEDGPLDFIKSIVNRMKTAINKVYSERKVNRAVDSFMKNLNKVNKTNMEQQGRVRGIDLPATEAWVAPFMRENIKKNVSYITNIRDDYAAKIENIILEGIENGSSHKAIREQLEEQISMSRNRAEFITVDQTGSLFGQMTAQRHQNMGVMKFKWRTSKDERVRKSHKVLENKVFSYDDPPEVGLPGTDFRCRCIAIPIFDDERG
ncbi:minor capsid protein [Metasolibacillus sp.]|uniref:phage head morphogenesis protein n=1 Tax=Metasolibacillus sp. TaxID=2703680 RepID=UPI0025FC9F8C|nr:minor capsid protein [Metasolibacillus sp.]MCT6926156.1 minor capsid protein [Metasolibacillus sp.]MCT6942411.1 minor capsid protein [Metasolibacillus sp.]